MPTVRRSGMPAVLPGHASVHPGTIIASLALVVALPLAAGLALRAARPVGAGAERAAAGAATATVAALVALIAAEVHLSASYLGVAAGLVLFLASSAVTGRILGLGASRPAGAAVLLTTSMRDFAIAAGLAAAAFGPAAAAPLGLYGIMVLVWGPLSRAPCGTAPRALLPPARPGSGPASPRWRHRGAAIAPRARSAPDLEAGLCGCTGLAPSTVRFCERGAGGSFCDRARSGWFPPPYCRSAGGGGAAAVEVAPVTVPGAGAGGAGWS